MKINGIGNVTGINGPDKKDTLKKPGINTGFNELLNNKLKPGVVFSKHASQRIAERNVNLTDKMLDKISDAIDLADAKGIKNSLLISDDLVFIVNVKTRTVVTAVDKESMKDKVFTNVDGAVSI